MVTKKPATVFGFYGKDSDKSSGKKLGLIHLLWRIYLKNFVKDLKARRNPKRAIIYVKRLEELIFLDEFLTLELENLDITKNFNSCPWVVNSSASGKVTAQRIRERAKEENSSIHLYITTSVMLFGLDIKDVSIVILLSPFNSLNSIIQAGGRAGRRQGNGKRSRSVVYTLFNGTDVRKNTPMEKSVKEFCTSPTCLKEKMNFHFSTFSVFARAPSWCCSFCSFEHFK